MTFERYAIYFAPEAGTPLEQFGARWFGLEDSNNASDPTNSVYTSAAHRRVIAAAKRYCFHGTLKAPFRLADGCDPEDLKSSLVSFAAREKAVQCGPLQLTALGAFLALTPQPDLDGLNKLAAKCVRQFDAFRAPLSKSEWVRRHPERLTETQRALLDRWGYPYVMEAFRFHITLTGPLDETPRDEVKSQLDQLIAPVCEGSFEVNSICLYGDPGDGKDFQFVERYYLS